MLPSFAAAGNRLALAIAALRGQGAPTPQPPPVARRSDPTCPAWPNRRPRCGVCDPRCRDPQVSRPAGSARLGAFSRTADQPPLARSRPGAACALRRRLPDQAQRGLAFAG